MFAVDTVIAFVVAIGIWYAASRGLAQFIFATETRNPHIAGRPIWGVVATAMTLGVFALSVGIWIGLTYLLERLGR